MPRAPASFALALLTLLTISRSGCSSCAVLCDPSGVLDIMVELDGEIAAFLHQRMTFFLELVLTLPFFRFEIDECLLGDVIHFLNPLAAAPLPLFGREFRVLFAAFPHQRARSSA